LNIVHIEYIYHSFPRVKYSKYML